MSAGSGSRPSGGRFVSPPADSVLPLVLPWRQVLGAGPGVRIALRSVRCWPEMVTFDVVIAALEGGDHSELFRHGVGRTDAGGVVLAVFYADGRSATTSRWREQPHGADLLLYPGGGDGGHRHSCQLVHLCPPPPPAPFTVTVEWPDRGIPRTATTLDGAEIRLAAEQAMPLWAPRDPG